MNTSPESNVDGYEVQWEVASGWAAVRTTETTAELDGLVPDGQVRVRALGTNGTVGWDWARLR